MSKKLKREIFEGTRPGYSVLNKDLECPVLYYRDDTAFAYFTANYKKVRELLPSKNLHPIKISPTRCIVAIAMYNYLHTTIGSYGEVGFAIPVCHNKKPLTALPALRQSNDKSFGFWVPHIPVSTQVACDGGRIDWGFPKFIADMHFETNSKYMECNLSSDGKKIFDIKVMKKGKLSNETRSLVPFLVKDSKLIKCPIGSRGVKMQSLKTKGSTLKVYPGHPMSDDWLKLQPSKKPFMTEYYLEHFAVLPEVKATVVEEGVKDWKGHFFTNGGKDGKHTTSYGGDKFDLNYKYVKEKS